MIDTNVLRSKVVDLALRGKLTEQLPKDGSSKEFLKKMSSGIEDNVKVDSDDEPFSIPDNWEWQRFIQVAEFKLGKTPSRGVKKYWSNGQYPWITIGDMNQPIIQNTNEKISKEAVDDCFTNEISKVGTLIMSFKLSIGKVAILGIDAFHNEAIISIYPRYDKQNVFRDYLRIVLPQASSNGKIHGAIKGNTLNKKSLSNLLIPVPPIAEQARIVKKVDDIFRVLDRIDALQAKYVSNRDVLKNKLIDAAICGNLSEQRFEDGSGSELYKQIQTERKRLIKDGIIKGTKILPEIAEDEIPFNIPKSWMWVRIGNVLQQNPSNDIDDSLDVSFVPMALVDEGYANKHSFEVKKWCTIKNGYNGFQEGDVGVAKITPCFQNRKSVVFRHLMNGYGACTTELTVHREILRNSIYPEYLLWFFKSDEFIKNGVESFTGVVGQQRIHKDYLKMCAFPLPPYSEQIRIVQTLESLLSAM